MNLYAIQDEDTLDCEVFIAATDDEALRRASETASLAIEDFGESSQTVYRVCEVREIGKTRAPAGIPAFRIEGARALVD